MQRCYGNDYGELYKPDSMTMGGGRGNGRDFDPAKFGESDESRPDDRPGAPDKPDTSDMPNIPGRSDTADNFPREYPMSLTTTCRADSAAWVAAMFP